ncbi:MAG: hypothetical protein IJ708_05415, partial [Clostridia bacterium]|nr:hypothetical protein [Clostridia bacterium]
AAVSWELDVPEDGLYAIHFKVLQSTDPGMPSYRQIMIDGEIPFEEMKLYAFPYDSHWYGDTLRDADGVPYQFYLEKGTHTLTATVKLGPSAKSCAEPIRTRRIWAGYSARLSR